MTTEAFWGEKYTTRNIYYTYYTIMLQILKVKVNQVLHFTEAIEIDIFLKTKISVLYEELCICLNVSGGNCYYPLFSVNKTNAMWEI